MDGRLEFLDSLMESDVVGYQTFILKYKKENKRNVVYCLSEGDDSKYYYARVNAITGLQPIFVQCNGRDGVLDTLNLIKSYEMYEEDYIYSFIDRDYFEVEDNKNVFVTEYYSIESYYCLEDVIASIFEYHWSLSRNREVLKECINLYKKLHQKFIEEILFFSVWSSIQILSTYQEKSEFQKTGNIDAFKPNNYIMLNSINITKLIDISLDDIQAPQIKDVKSIMASNKAFKNAVIVTDERVNNIIADISSEEKRQFIRGKFEFQFVVKFLNLLSMRLNLAYKFKIPQNIEDPLLTLSNFAFTSPNLKGYIDGVYSFK